jgi:hypothetical protein
VAFSALEKLGAISDAWLRLLQVIGVLGGIGALYAVFAAAVTWSNKEQWVWYRVWNVLLALACVGFFWFSYHWHLLNFGLHY